MNFVYIFVVFVYFVNVLFLSSFQVQVWVLIFGSKVVSNTEGFKQRS